MLKEKLLYIVVSFVAVIRYLPWKRADSHHFLLLLVLVGCITKHLFCSQAQKSNWWRGAKWNKISIPIQRIFLGRKKIIHKIDWNKSKTHKYWSFGFIWIYFHFYFYLFFFCCNLYRLLLCLRVILWIWIHFES